MADKTEMPPVTVRQPINNGGLSDDPVPPRQMSHRERRRLAKLNPYMLPENEKPETKLTQEQEEALGYLASRLEKSEPGSRHFKIAAKLVVIPMTKDPSFREQAHRWMNQRHLSKRGVSPDDIASLLRRSDLSDAEREVLTLFAVPETQPKLIPVAPFGDRPPPSRDEPRLADLIIRDKSRNPAVRELVAKVGAAEKFYLDWDTTRELQHILLTMDQEILEGGLIPVYARFPYRNCWIEYANQFALHVESDDTLQRGTISQSYLGEDGNAHHSTFRILFNFLADYTPGDDFAADIGITDNKTIEHMVKPGKTRPGEEPRHVDPAVQRIIDRFVLTYSRDADKQEIRNLYRDMVSSGFHYHVLTIMFLNFPKPVVTYTKEDFNEYNKSRRRLGLHRSQRQEYHIVNVAPHRTELDEEVAKLIAERREYRGGTHASPGEHMVRGHYATSKLGFRYWRNPHRRGRGPVKSSRKGYKVPRLELSPEDI